jgi:hypothetical protein
MLLSIVADGVEGQQHDGALRVRIGHGRIIVRVVSPDKVRHDKLAFWQWVQLAVREVARPELRRYVGGHHKLRGLLDFLGGEGDHAGLFDELGDLAPMGAEGKVVVHAHVHAVGQLDCFAGGRVDRTCHEEGPPGDVAALATHPLEV